MSTFIFWFFASLVVYVYVGYPVLISLLALRTNGESHPSNPNPEFPTLTILIAAFNEERYIREKVENALSVEYPADRLSVFVVSDGSTDATDDIVGEFDDEKLTFMRVDEQAGKANALNRALERIETDLVVFTDANVFFHDDAIANAVQLLMLERAGAVTGRVELVGLDNDEPLGEGAYMKLERLMQAAEAKFYSVVGIDGAFFVARRELVSALPKGTILDDFLISMRIVSQGQVVLYDPDAVAIEKVPARVSQEFRRKVRIATGAFQALPHIEFLRRPLSNLRLTFMFVSHKLFRWLSPLFLIAVFVSNLILLPHNFYAATLVLQIAVFAIAGIAACLPRLRQITLFYIPYYFCAVNLAMLVGLLKSLNNQQTGVWKRVER